MAPVRPANATATHPGLLQYASWYIQLYFALRGVAVGRELCEEADDAFRLEIAPWALSTQRHDRFHGLHRPRFRYSDRLERGQQLLISDRDIRRSTLLPDAVDAILACVIAEHAQLCDLLYPVHLGPDRWLDIIPLLDRPSGTYTLADNEYTVETSRQRVQGYQTPHRGTREETPAQRE